ncbi:Probable ion channel POLLUX (AtPOLLUX) (Probable ion channel DMI1) [Durusdinium trenchii]|uniref:Probable ion channel POLLUX (AtPOLLUX) (Probable ion channel DMI1) n=1 Tax=Durusdinium trenchii TaxID=1381693 RepID=A0ABP0RTV7_9DINO
MRHPTWGVILLAAALLEVSAASHARKAHGTMNEEEDEQEECTQGAPFVEEPEPTEVSWLNLDKVSSDLSKVPEEFGYHIAHIIWLERHRFQQTQAAHQAGDVEALRTLAPVASTAAVWWCSGDLLSKLLGLCDVSHVKVLLVLSATLLVVGGIGHSALSQASIQESLWRSWIWIADPDGGESALPGGHAVGVVVSIGGMLIFALLLSLITSAFEDFLWQIRHGSIPVVEGTTVDDRELCCAMETSGGGLIAILSTEGKAEVESWIQHADIDLRNSSVVVRSGLPYNEEDLTRVAVQTARRIVVLANRKISREEADAQTLNVLLTLQGLDYTNSKDHASLDYHASGLFEGLERFNEDISAWETSQVRDMSSMFRGAKAFKMPIGRNKSNTIEHA